MTKKFLGEMTQDEIKAAMPAQDILWLSVPILGHIKILFDKM